MAYNSISTKHYIKSHLELQREITLIELAPSPYFFVSSICLAYMNMFARFDENPAMTLRVIKEKALREKLSKFSQLSFRQKLFFLNKTPSCICSMCLNCIGKVSNCSIKSCGRS